MGETDHSHSHKRTVKLLGDSHFRSVTLLSGIALILSGCVEPKDESLDRWTDAAAPSSAPIKMRWYTAEQVVAGEPLYRKNCQECHRDKAQGTVDWKRRDAAGNLPPPPLNGTAHAWHHSLNVLRRVVREGGVRLGGTMPGFADTLNAEQIDAILAWVQSHWSEEIYVSWLERGGPSQ